MKRAGFVVFLGILLALVICATPIGGIVKANGEYEVEVVGQDDPICETPYRLANPTYEPPYYPNPAYDPTDFFTWKYLVNTSYDANIPPFLTNPSNVIDCDLERIQEAVDAASDGDSIILRGTFNLGEGNPRLGVGIDPQTVFIPKDLTIEGEGNGESVIKGGYRVFTVGLEPIDFDYDTAYDSRELGASGVTPISPASVTIKNIQFENPLFSAIWLAGMKDDGTTSIEGNQFTDSKIMPWTQWYHMPTSAAIYMGTPASMNIPGWIDPDCDGTCAYPRMVDGDIRTGTALKGNVRIHNNEFDGRARLDRDGVSPFEYSGDARTFEGYEKFLLMWYSDADVTITNNSINSFVGRGISLGGYFREVAIENNQIFSGPHHFVGAGIQMAEHGYGGPLFGKGFTEGDKETAKTKIVNNTIEVQGSGDGNGIGILAWLAQDVEIRGNYVSASIGHKHALPWSGIHSYASENTVIADNQIYVENIEWGAIAIEDDAYGHLVTDNKISGSGRAAVHLGWPWYSNENNTIQDNDFSYFSPVAHTDLWGVTTIGSHIALVWGASNNTIIDNRYSEVKPRDSEIQNIYFAGPIPPYGLPGATGNVVREDEGLKIMDYTDPNGPLYHPDTYAGENDIKLAR